MNNYLRYFLYISILGVFGILLFSALINIYVNKDRIIYTLKGTTAEGRERGSSYTADTEQVELAKKIIKGGYILYFRHAHREKWIDVAMYDAMEATNLLKAEELYFKDAVCLSSMGIIQAQMMGEFIKEIGLPIGKIITSPSCRSRQTSEIAFGDLGDLKQLLLHPGPYNENLDEFAESIKNEILSLRFENNTNAIISAHNGVIKANVFDKIEKDFEFDLEEGGFYVIKNDDGRLVLVDKFHNFQFFQQIFYPRPKE